MTTIAVYLCVVGMGIFGFVTVAAIYRGKATFSLKWWGFELYASDKELAGSTSRKTKKRSRGS